MQTVSELEIYIHIPFCVKKCAYCDFLSFPCSGENDDIARYVSALINEISYRKNDEVAQRLQNEAFVVTSVFFGGGTSGD